MNASPLIEARGLRLSRGGQIILDNIDLDIGPDEIVTLIGPNGAGKSTLVRALLGLEKLDAGEITRKPKMVVGYQAQRMAIDRTLPLTVRRFLNLTGRRTETDMLESLAMVDVDHLIGQSVHTLSGGEMQRVQLARAILRKPDILVLDEPTQNVDLSGAAEIYKLIEHLRATFDCAVLLVSHDLNVVMSATNRVYCINNHVCCSGRPHEIGRHPEFLKLFGPVAGDALAVYSHDHDHSHGPSGEIIAPDHDVHSHHQHSH